MAATLRLFDSLGLPYAGGLGNIEASEEIKRIGRYLVIPAAGRRDLISPRIPLTLPAGAAPEIRAGHAGTAFYRAASASNNGYRFGAALGLNRGSLVVILRADAVPSAATFSGIGGQYFTVGWSHTNASFRGAAYVRRFSGGYTTASFGTLNANTVYCLAVHYDGVVTAKLSSIKNGSVAAEASADGAVFASTDNIGTNQVAAQGYTFGGDVYAIWQCNDFVPLELLKSITKSPAAFFDFATEPRSVYLPIPAAAAGYTHPTLSAATATEIGTTSFKPRVTYTFA